MTLNLKLHFYRFILLIFCYQLIRILFLVVNFSQFSQKSFSDFIMAFAVGFRYDLSAIALTYLPFLIFSVIPKINKIPTWRKVENLIFIFLNSLLLALNIGDIEYSNFVGRRLTYDTFKIQQDIQNAAFSILQYYSSLVVITVLFIAVFILTSQKLYRNTINFNPIKNYSQLLYNVIFFALLLISGRGGLQLKPLKTAHATLWVKPDLIQLSTNSTFTILKNLKSDELKMYTFFKNEDEVYNSIHTSPPLLSQNSVEYKAKILPNGPIKNIVVIIMESFSLEYIGKANGGFGYTPFLDQLIDKSIFFKESFANGRRSIEALPSILCGLPSLMKEAFITSKYSDNQLLCLPEILKQHGFKTLFFHGAENGSMFFDSFSKKIGFDHYFGLTEYPDPRHKDGTWGVFDDPFFQFAAEEIKKINSKHLSVIFSLSSHHPYLVPKEYANKFPKGTLEIHESIGYADYALSNFFKSIEKDKSYNETLFVVTADHTQKSDHPYYKNFLGSYRVPILFFFPPGWQSQELYNSHHIFQHIDITPTILDLIFPSSLPYYFIGKSFNSETHGQAFNFTDENYWILRGDKLVRTNITENLEYFSYESETGSLVKQDYKEEHHNGDNLLKSLQAILQYYSHGLKKNKLKQKILQSGQ